MQKTMRIPISRGKKEALIDADDYPLVAAYRWNAMENKFGHCYAAASGTTAEGKRTTLYMHRLITGAPKGKEVDHVNHETLDNRRANLRVGSHLDNMRNGKFALATHCPKGHPYDAKNTYFDKRGRRCRQCALLRGRAVLAAETPDHKAKRVATKKAYYQRNREAIAERQSEYGKKNLAKIRRRARAWYAENRAKKA